MAPLFRRKNLKLFGEIALEKGLLTAKDIDEAVRTQKEYREKHNIHKKIGAILAEKGVLAPEDVTAVLREQKSQMGIIAWFSALFGLSR